MISGFFKQFSYILLAGGVILGIVDATRTVASDSLQITTLGSVMSAYYPGLISSLNSGREILSIFSIGGWNAGSVIEYFYNIPVALLAAGLFLLIYMAATGKRGERHF